MMGASILGGGAMFPESERPPRYHKPSHPCSLPGCGVMHQHNGGYCCAEHCRMHRQQKEKLGVAANGQTTAALQNSESQVVD